MAKQLSVKQKLTLAFDLPSCIKGDKARICQVSNNLIHNALRFAATYSLVKVDVNLDSNDALNVTVTNSGGQVREDQVRLLFKPKQ